MTSKDPLDLTIDITSDDDGHTVEWVLNGRHGRLGPYLDREMAERVLEAKRLELEENHGATPT
jgi:hypothetical protein